VTWAPSAMFIYAAQRRTLGIEISLDLRTRTREARHRRAKRHALHHGDLAIGQTLEHNQQQRAPLILPKPGNRPPDVAAAELRSGEIGNVVVLDRRQ
jgi:hypothetical protein